MDVDRIVREFDNSLSVELKYKKKTRRFQGVVDLEVGFEVT